MRMSMDRENMYPINRYGLFHDVYLPTSCFLISFFPRLENFFYFRTFEGANIFPKL